MCLSPITLWVRIPLRRQVGGFLRVFRFPPPIKLTYPTGSNASQPGQFGTRTLRNLCETFRLQDSSAPGQFGTCVRHFGTKRVRHLCFFSLILRTKLTIVLILMFWYLFSRFHKIYSVPNCPGAELSWCRNVSHRFRSVLVPNCPGAEVSSIRLLEADFFAKNIDIFYY
jgi:hypothetical protein